AGARRTRGGGRGRAGAVRAARGRMARGATEPGRRLGRARDVLRGRRAARARREHGVADRVGVDGAARRDRTGPSRGPARRRVPGAQPGRRRPLGGVRVHGHVRPAARLSSLRAVPAALPAPRARPVSGPDRVHGMTAAAAQVDRAYAECVRIARHYENFPIGSFLLPRRLRRDLAAVYAFARGGDDLADEGDPAGRLAALAAYEERLIACVADPAAVVGDPVFLALGHTIAKHDLGIEPLRDLITAFRRDAAGETRTMPTFADLVEYCRCSANPVGR